MTNSIIKFVQQAQIKGVYILQSRTICHFLYDKLVIFLNNTCLMPLKQHLYIKKKSYLLTD